MFQFSIVKPGSKDIKGFTLLETLVTIVIIGLLSAIAVPSFMGQISRAEETEAKITLNTLKKSQYSFYLENSRFTDEIEQLELVASETENYAYYLQGHPRLNGMFHLAFSKQEALRSFGAVVHLKDGQLEECGLFSIDISKKHSGIEILRFGLNAVENYERYCS